MSFSYITTYALDHKKRIQKMWPVNIKGGSRRVWIHWESLRRSVANVSKRCEVLHENFGVPVDQTKIWNLENEDTVTMAWNLPARHISPYIATFPSAATTLTCRWSSSRMLDVFRLRWSSGGFMLWRKFMPIEASWIIWNFFGHISVWLARRLFNDPLLMYSITMPVTSLHTP